MPVTVYMQHKDGHDNVFEYDSAKSAMHGIEEEALDVAENCTEKESLERFPIYWSICELGATDICASGYVNKFGEIE